MELSEKKKKEKKILLVGSKEQGSKEKLVEVGTEVNF